MKAAGLAEVDLLLGGVTPPEELTSAQRLAPALPSRLKRRTAETEGAFSKKKTRESKVASRVDQLTAVLNKMKSVFLALQTEIGSLRDQQTFIETQFASFVGRLDRIQADILACTADIKKLNQECNKLHTQVTKAESTAMKRYNELEAALAQQEDRTRRDNIRILSVPEGAESDNMLEYINSSIPSWFWKLAGGQFEIMRAHRIVPTRKDRSGPRTICKMLRFTDRDRILQAARKLETPLMIDGRNICFTADYSNYTVTRRRAFSKVMDTARKQGYKAFLLYPARLKLTRSGENHLFDEPTKAKDFLNPVPRRTIRTHQEMGKDKS
ncbi:hypothetical protein ABVT39_018069 [Epinephelus coioides]